MEFLRKYSDFLRQHYEKILLSLALLALAGAVLFLNHASRVAKEKIDGYVISVERRGGASVKPVDLSGLETILKQAQAPAPLDLSSPHNLLNPVKWLRKQDGSMIKSVKGTEATLDQLQIVRINPLMLTVAFDRYTGTGYMISTTNEASATQRRMIGYYTLNDTNKPLYILREVTGPQDNPDAQQLVLELKDGGERITISQGKPYTRTNAFEVDLKYETRNFLRQRVNAVINLSGEDYKIVAINPTEVVFSATNDKKYTVRPNTQR